MHHNLLLVSEKKGEHQKPFFWQLPPPHSPLANAVNQAGTGDAQAWVQRTQMGWDNLRGTAPNRRYDWGLDGVRGCDSKTWMLILTETVSTNDEIQHRAWTRIGETHFRVSHLQNQFALAEFAMAPAEALLRFRRWLWQEMQHDRGVVWRELSELANAHEAGKDVEILVPQGAGHGAVILSAVEWMVEHTKPRTMPERHYAEPTSTAWEISDGTLTTNADIDAADMVWMTGKTQSRLGVVRDAVDVLVPEYGHIPLKQARHIERMTPARAEAPALQQRLREALDLDFEAEADASPVAYEPAPPYKPADRFDRQTAWREAGKDDESQVDALAQETDHSAVVDAVIKDVPDEEPRYEKRPPDNLKGVGDMVKPAWLYRGENAPLMMRSSDDQQTGKPFRHVTQAEAQAYQKAHRQPQKQVEMAVEGQEVAGANTLPLLVRERCRQTLWSAESHNLADVGKQLHQQQEAITGRA